MVSPRLGVKGGNGNTFHFEARHRDTMDVIIGGSGITREYEYGDTTSLSRTIYPSMTRQGL